MSNLVSWSPYKKFTWPRLGVVAWQFFCPWQLFYGLAFYLCIALPKV